MGYNSRWKQREIERHNAKHEQRYIEENSTHIYYRTKRAIQRTKVKVLMFLFGKPKKK